MNMAFLDINITGRLETFSLDFTAKSAARSIALFGPSGAGKTSIAHMIAGLLTPASGHIRLGSVSLFDHALGINLPPRHRHIGYVFQDGRLFPHLTVESNLLYGRKWRNSASPSIDMATVLNLLDLSPLLARHPASLSGGERQRVAIGRALLSAPRLLLLDEPLSALDETRREDIIAYLQRLREAELVPMITISHRREEVGLLADEVILVKGGQCRGQLDTHAFARLGQPQDE
jgi:molybdate transport system ATP-binding protein